MLIAGGMLLTGTSVSALARGIGRGLQVVFFGGVKASEATARTARQSSEEWRQRRDERTAVTKEAQTDVMRDYPEDDEVEPTVALADRRTTTSSPRASSTSTTTPSRTRRKRRSSPRAGAGARARRARAGTGPAALRPRSRPRRTRPKPTPMGNLRGVTTSEEIDYRLPSPRVLERGKGDKGPDPRRPADDRPQTDRGARPLRGRGEDRRRRQRPARLPLRTAPRPRHQSQESHRAGERPRLRAGLDRHPHPRADPRQTGGRGRDPEREAPHGPPRRHLRRPPGEVLAAGRLARQGHRRQRGLDRHREDAARARRRHHRLGQERLRQRDALLDPDGGLAERSAPGAGRPEAGRAQPLRARPAPADPGGDLAAARRQRARQPDHRDGDALRRDVAGPRPQPRGAEPDPPQSRRGAAAAHPLRDRRARGPDDGRPGRSRGLDHPARAEVPRHRHPPGAGDAAPLDRHHHRHDQGEHPARGSPSPSPRRPTRG